MPEKPNGSEKPGDALALPTNSIADMVAQSGLREFISWDAATPEGARMLLTATMGKLPTIKSMVKEWLEVVHVYSHDVEDVGDDGEVNIWQRTVIFTADGKAFDCGSEGVVKSIRTMSRMRGKVPPWDPPIKCMVKLDDIGNGKQWLTLYPDVESLFANKETPATRK